MADETTDIPPAGGGAETTKVASGAETAASEDWATRYKYLLADFDNFRRRTERDREAISRQARAGLIRELLPIIESFRAARDSLAHLPLSDPVRKGLDLLDLEWTTFLKHEGVEPVARIGRPFRPEEAEAVGDAVADPSHPDGTVAEVVQQGYRFYGGLLRPAKVVVARAKPEKGEKGENASEDTADEPPPARE